MNNGSFANANEIHVNCDMVINFHSIVTKHSQNSCIVMRTRKLKGWIGSIFDHHVMLWLQPPFWWSHMVGELFASRLFRRAYVPYIIFGVRKVLAKKATNTARNCLLSQRSENVRGTTFVHVWQQNSVKDRFPFQLPWMGIRNFTSMMPRLHFYFEMYCIFKRLCDWSWRSSKYRPFCLYPIMHYSNRCIDYDHCDYDTLHHSSFRDANPPYLIGRLPIL